MVNEFVSDAVFVDAGGFVHDVCEYRVRCSKTPLIEVPGENLPLIEFGDEVWLVGLCKVKMAQWCGNCQWHKNRNSTAHGRH